MDAVKSFNAELSSLYEVKPPISKAKMTAITRGAIKAIKFYKHVVQSVEKFILKCKPEYKVPGLYVIDSIVRQSRHQFGADKDVFAPRFAKNMQQTFLNLFKCPAEDKSKVIRVLNLWQKNQVFAPDVIQPLFDLADPNNPIHKELATAAAAAAAATTPQQSNGINTANTSIIKGSPALQKTPTKGSQQGNDGSHLGGSNLNLSDPNVLAQFQQLQRLLQRSGDSSSKPEAPVHFDRKLLDFDYGDDDDEVHSTPKQPPVPPAANESVASLLTNPEVLRQLQTLQQTMTTSMQSEMDMDKLRKLQEMKQQEEEFDKHLAQTVPNLPFASECEFMNKQSTVGYFMPSNADLSQPPPGYKTQPSYELSQPPIIDSDQFGLSQNNNDDDVEVINLDHLDSRSPSPDDRYNRRRRSRSRSRERRDRERDRRSRRSRTRSRSRTRRHRSRSRDRNKIKEKETERDRERKKRGLPVMKKENLSVCSTTLWVGHLSKLVHQEDLSNTFGEFGDIVSIDLIPPRGCAFIVMHRRQDAARCLNKLKNHILHGKAITLAWAPGKGVKGKDLKDYWEGDLGVSYIPWSKIKPDIDTELLEDGGMIDEETMPPWMNAKLSQSSNPTNSSNNTSAPLEPPAFLQQIERPLDTSQPPPVPGGGLLQPPPMALPMVPPFQFNNRLLGAVGMLPPNISLGVPPPQLPSLMQNSLVGLGSPFQTPPSLIPPQLHPQNNDDKSADLILSQFGIVPQAPQISMSAPNDDMDIEMEDAEKEQQQPQRQPLLSEQLEASIMNFRHRDEDLRQDRGSGGGGSDRRSFRDRNNDRYNNRDRDDDRGRNNRRKDDDRNRRGDRPNRWGDRDESTERLERRDREKNLNERLQQMANQDYNPNHDRPPQRDFPPLEGPPMNPDLNEWMEPPQDDYNDGGFEPPPDFPVLPPHGGGMPPHGGGMPPHGGGMHHQQRLDQRMHRDDFEPPPQPQERFMRGGGGGGRGGRRGDFGDRNRGPPQDFFPPPRDNFGPRGPPPLMRSGPGDFGPPRGPPMMRGPGPHKFHPRGPMQMRGPRPNMHRGNFNSRFEHPPDFFRGPPGGGPHGGNFDEPPHMRHRNNRFEDRRRPPRDFHDNDDRFNERRNSRWGNHSPRNNFNNEQDSQNDHFVDNDHDNDDGNLELEPPPPLMILTAENVNASVGVGVGGDNDDDNGGGGGGGGDGVDDCTTPLHDENAPSGVQQKQDEVISENNDENN